MQLVWSHAFEVRKVEAQILRIDERARLLHMRSENATQRFVQNVRYRVLTLDVATTLTVDHGKHAVTGCNVKGLLADVDDGIPHLANFLNAHGLSAHRYHTRIAHLSAHLHIERRLGQHYRCSVDIQHIRCYLCRCVANEFRSVIDR